jgi:2-dehydro-3-deoxyphosphogluconate aldolase/(4S)-4-hydroxy-2-oxoglutarate aldolase
VTRNASEIRTELGRRRIIAVIRAPDAGSAVAAGEALARGGVTALEVAFTTPNAPDAIARLARQSERLIVGAGTVTTTAQAHEALDNGAAFLMSPHLATDVLDVGDERNALAIPGAFTATEVAAGAARSPLVKLFPGSVGGPGLLSALRGPFPDLALIPTGGITLENIGDWLAAGAYAVGAGEDLCPAHQLTEGDFTAIEHRAMSYARSVNLRSNEVSAVSHE